MDSRTASANVSGATETECCKARGHNKPRAFRLNKVAPLRQYGIDIYFRACDNASASQLNGVTRMLTATETYDATRALHSWLHTQGVKPTEAIAILSVSLGAIIGHLVRDQAELRETIDATVGLISDVASDALDYRHDR
jgi:hypothetical protein